MRNAERSDSTSGAKRLYPLLGIPYQLSLPRDSPDLVQNNGRLVIAVSYNECLEQFPRKKLKAFEYKFRKCGAKRLN